MSYLPSSACEPAQGGVGGLTTRWASPRPGWVDAGVAFPRCVRLISWIHSTFGWSPPWRVPVITNATPRKTARQFNRLQIGGVHNDYQQSPIRPTYSLHTKADARSDPIPALQR